MPFGISNQNEVTWVSRRLVDANSSRLKEVKCQKRIWVEGRRVRCVAMLENFVVTLFQSHSVVAEVFTTAYILEHADMLPAEGPTRTCDGCIGHDVVAALQMSPDEDFIDLPDVKFGTKIDTSLHPGSFQFQSIALINPYCPGAVFRLPCGSCRTHEVSEGYNEVTHQVVPAYYGSEAFQKREASFHVSRAFMNARLHLPNVWESLEQLQRITALLHDSCFRPSSEEVILLQQWVSDETAHPDAAAITESLDELQYWPTLLRTRVAPDGILLDHVASLLVSSGKALARYPLCSSRYADFAELVLFSANLKDLRALLEKPTQAYPPGAPSLPEHGLCCQHPHPCGNMG
jgi:hypothetical protein